LAIRPLAFVRRSRAAALADPASADSLRTYPTRKVRWNWPVQTYIGLVSNIAHLTGDQRKELRRMNRELEELLDADEPPLVEPDKPGQARKTVAVSDPHGQPCPWDRASYWKTFVRNRVATEVGREKETCDASAETPAASIVNITDLLPPNRRKRCAR